MHIYMYTAGAIVDYDDIITCYQYICMHVHVYVASTVVSCDHSTFYYTMSFGGEASPLCTLTHIRTTTHTHHDLLHILELFQCFWLLSWQLLELSQTHHGHLRVHA